MIALPEKIHARNQLAGAEHFPAPTRGTSVGSGQADKQTESMLRMRLPLPPARSRMPKQSCEGNEAP
jgi:hypothetical protein